MTRTRTTVLLSPLLLALPAAATAAAQGTGVWERRASLAVPRQETGAAGFDGKVYVGGGLAADRRALASVERYDPATDRWVRVADLPTTLHHFGMAESGGRLYAVGGYISGFTGIAAVHAYDPATGRWSPRAPLPRARGALAAVEIGGLIYAVGGVVPGVGVVGDLTVYDPATDVWTTLAPMPTPREHLSAAAIDGMLYVAGGRTPTQLFGVLERFDPATGRWTRLADMPTPRGGLGAAALFGRLVVIGGEGPRNFPEVEEYDPATDTWRALTFMPQSLHGIYPVVVGDEILVAGGGTSPGFAATDLVLAFRYERPVAACRVAPAVVAPGRPLTYSLALYNPGLTRPVDLYLGYILSTGLVAGYRADFTLGPIPPLAPTLGGFALPGGFLLPESALGSLPGALFPRGAHHGFLLLTARDAFAKGRLDPGDVLAFSFSPFTVQ